MNNMNNKFPAYICDKEGNRYILNEKVYENQIYHITCWTILIDNKEFFVKILNYGQINDNKLKNDLLTSYKKEADALSKFPFINNIPHLKFSYDDRKMYYIVMDKIPGISLKKWLQLNKKDSLNYKDVVERLEIIKQLVLIMQKIKINGIYLSHKDLKPENIMINNKKVYIIDFGCLLSKRIRNIGTRNYQAPEQILNSDNHCLPSSKTDIFSLGQILYELLNGEVPNFDREYVDNIDGKSWIKRPKINESLKSIKELRFDDLCELALQMTERDADKRCTYDTITRTINNIIGAHNNGNIRKRKFNS